MSFTISAGNAKRLSGRTPEKWFSRLTLSALQSHRRGFTGFLTPVLGFTPPSAQSHLHSSLQRQGHQYCS
ncbi:hypothetical protein PLEOSDRAFT_1110117 [Pleurotus ostreatus PC15]|uniref:Uncharacterized protein n=1 Tax=Pleurotus ostreatus (strain PC15) TaxID=1137138 RepID=A0A067NDZ0_PLEO1|nr:hypothetical protein PLEOSDRAFT_1110117 [Pleurotus ostreatus PC15]